MVRELRDKTTPLSAANARIEEIRAETAGHPVARWAFGSVLSAGGLAVLSYTVWLGPFGGHEMGVTHYLGGARAAARYTRRHGHPPKNNYGSSLFAVSVADGLDWARSTGMLVAAFPRYHPRWAWGLTAVPVLREFLVSNLVLVLRPWGLMGRPQGVSRNSAPVEAPLRAADAER